MTAGSLEVDGHEVPHVFTHIPFIQAVQFWSTWNRELAKPSKADFGTGPLTNNMNAAYHSVAGLAQMAPGLESMADMAQTVTGTNMKSAMRVTGAYTRGMVVPGFMQNIAKWQDVRGDKGDYVQRGPKNFMDELNMGIPAIGSAGDTRYSGINLPGGHKIPVGRKTVPEKDRR